MTAARLFGREREILALTGLIDAGAAGGQAAMLTGDPGIGKSALLGVAEGAARAAGFCVLSASGVESEAQFPFAGLHQLLRPVLDCAGRLRPVHRRALLFAFGLAEGPQPELFLIALATVKLFAAVAADRPVLVLADDLQWLDPQTQEVLTFAALRAAPYRVVIIGVMRTGHPGPFRDAGLQAIKIGALDDPAAHEILRQSAGDLSAADRLRIRREAQGNPLALLELPAAWRDRAASPADWQSPTLSARLERAFAGRLAELPALTRDAVLVAAVDPVTDLTEILAATTHLSRSAAALEAFGPAAEAGLLHTADGHVHFRHPLVRSGVLQSETLSRRQAAHAALAAVLADDPYRRTWHRAQSIIGPDDQVADALEANVAVALSRGAVMSAIADLQRSAQLTSASARRGHRLLMAAEHAFGLGRRDLVAQLVLTAARTDLSELDTARMQWLREIFNDGVPGDATRVLELCAMARQSSRAGDADLALNLLLGAALRCWWADTGPAARTRVIQVTRENDNAVGDPRYVAALAVAEPVLECAAVTGMLSSFESRDVADADALRLLGMAAHAVGDTVRSVDLLRRSEAMLRKQGRLGLLSQVLSMQVIDRLELGDWTGAAAAAQEGQRTARETGQPIWSTGTLVCHAMLDAFGGRSEKALARAAEVEMAASRQRLNDLLACVQLVRGSALAAAGQDPAAYRELRRLFDPADLSFHQRERYGGLMFLAEAAIGAGQRDDAREVVAALEPVAAATPSPLLHVHLRYARAVLADDSTAAELYACLMGQELSRWPFALARAQLAYGSWLRRQHRYDQARDVLRTARAAFTGIGAAIWADRAAPELKAAIARKPSPL